MWFNHFGWKENPFSVKPNTELIGLEKKKKRIFDFIDSGSVCFLTGVSGVGKTSLLKYVYENIKKHTPVYIDAEELNEFFDLTAYLKEHKSLWENLLKREYPKNLIVLLDEAQATEEDLKKTLKLHWDQDHVKSIIISQIRPIDNFTDSFKERIGNRVIRLDKMTKSEVADLIKLRIGKNSPFDKEAVALIGEKSDYLPRKILENCELVCIEMADKDKKEINAFDVESVLKKQTKVKKVTEFKEDAKAEKSLKKLSPMQTKIVHLLKGADKTTQELADSLNTSEGSVGKQLSKLSAMDIVTVKGDRRPKIYGLK